MPDTGWLPFQVAATQALDGDSPWTNVNNVLEDMPGYAECELENQSLSYYLLAKSPSFETLLPSGANITGLYFRIDREKEPSSTRRIYDYVVRPVVNNVITGNDVADIGDAWSTDLVQKTYGDGTLMGLASLATSQLDAGFGVAIQVEGRDHGAILYARIHGVYVMFEYETARPEVEEIIQYS